MNGKNLKELLLRQWLFFNAIFLLHSLTVANRTRFLTSYFTNALFNFNRRSHYYDSFNCLLRIR